ncbi:MAG: LytR/AlgR family response regulator transcription factor, partial [Alkaliphilus sp.]
KHKINLFFLDIDLKKRTGIKLAQTLRDYEEYALTWIVFVSASSQDMLKAFKEVNCYDFIIKPSEKNKIQNIAVKLLGYKDTKLANKTYYSFDTADNEKAKIKKEDIYFIATENRKCIMHTKMGQYVTQKKSLYTIINEVEMENLIQSHKSFAVNVCKIEKIEKSFLYSEIVFKGYEERALLGRKFKREIENYVGG